jgi:hypothetical protein
VRILVTVFWAVMLHSDMLGYYQQQHLTEAHNFTAKKERSKALLSLNLISLIKMPLKVQLSLKKRNLRFPRL